MTTNEVVVNVVDDDEAVCKAICRLMRSVGLNAQSYSSAQAFLDDHDPTRPGCLILDVRMPGVDGLELQDILAERSVRIPIVFVTGHGDVPMCVRAMKNGAFDFVPKPFNDQVLLDAVRRCLQRDAQLRQQEAERATIQDRYQTLTPREHEVMHLVVAGRLNKQIAAELHASEKAIKVHRERLMKKMDAASLADLVLLAEAIGVAQRESTPHEQAARRRDTG